MTFEETKAKYQEYVEVRDQIALEDILSVDDELQTIDEHHPLLHRFSKNEIESFEHIYLYLWGRKYGINEKSRSY